MEYQDNNSCQGDMPYLEMTLTRFQHQCDSQNPNKYKILMHTDLPLHSSSKAPSPLHRHLPPYLHWHHWCGFPGHPAQHGSQAHPPSSPSPNQPWWVMHLWTVQLCNYGWYSYVLMDGTVVYIWTVQWKYIFTFLSHMQVHLYIQPGYELGSIFS